MKSILLLSIGLLSSFVVNCQENPIAYYTKIQNAERLYALKNFDEALKIYEQAFKSENFVTETNLKSARFTAKKAKNKTAQKKFKQQIATFEKDINLEYKKFADSLSLIDQHLRKKSEYIDAIRYLNSIKHNEIAIIDTKKQKEAGKLVSHWLENDSICATALIQKIQSSGFPGQRVVGKSANSKCLAILIHFSVNSYESVFDSIIHSALLNGDITPSAYAYIVDCQKFRHDEQQIYFQYQGCKLDEITLEEKKKVIENRKMIGLFTTKSSCIAKNLPFTIEEK